MTPKEALIYHLSSVFPILQGPDFGVLFTWKAVTFILCGFLAWLNPARYFWAVLLMFGLAPVFVFFDNSDPVSKFVHFYLVWMCAELSYRSLPLEPESRLKLWWVFPLAVLFLL